MTLAAAGSSHDLSPSATAVTWDRPSRRKPANAIPERNLEARAINKMARGVIQSGAEYRYPEDWCNAATEAALRPPRIALTVDKPPVETINKPNSASETTVKPITK